MILWRKVFRLRLDEIDERVWLEARHIFQVNVLGRRHWQTAEWLTVIDDQPNDACRVKYQK